jgi:hypothetical protein
MPTRLLAGAAVLATVIGAAAAVATTLPASAATPACRASQLRPHYDGSDGTAGGFHDLWHFTNVGATCHTIGFVGAQNFGADGRPLPTTVTRLGSKHTITLRHGQKASWNFSYTDPGVLGCTPEAATNMIVTPPNNTVPVLAGQGEPACHGAFTATALVFAG